MSERPDPHPSDAVVGDHGKPEEQTAAPSHDDHGHAGDGHGGDGHGGDGHGGEALGPFDLPKWGAAALGVILGLVVVFAFVQATT